MSESPYAVLGLDPSADAQAIRRTYRRIMRELHPDVNDDPQASEVAARVTAAYEILGNPVLAGLSCSVAFLSFCLRRSAKATAAVNSTQTPPLQNRPRTVATAGATAPER